MGDIILVLVLLLLIILGSVFVIYKIMSGAQDFKQDIPFKPHKIKGDHNGHERDL